ncbi:hypothetical protein BASA81_008822 [Batrachochytrium salamandrivorans]|nr:hypothetical protein BASA81_008822 [Batrachochytrium salamandrivorans]
MIATKLHRLLWLAIGLYAVTGIISPILIDYISQTTQMDVLSLGPVVANTFGMACMHLVTSRLRVRPGVNTTINKPWQASEIKLALMDLLSASLVTIGLVNVGATTFTVIYSSTVSWTALISWYRKTSVVTFHQAIGVLLVTVGLGANGYGHAKEDDSSGVGHQAWLEFVLTSGLLLLGTIVHAVVIIQMDEFSKAREKDEDDQTTVIEFASRVGQIEFLVLVLWNVVRMGLGGWVTMDPQAVVWYVLLSGNHLLHSLAFFYMIGQLGAVGSAVLKGFLALATFGLAAMLFCSEANTKQCLTPIKSLSMLLVFGGGVIYGACGSGGKKKQALPL